MTDTHLMNEDDYDSTRTSSEGPLNVTICLPFSLAEVLSCCDSIATGRVHRQVEVCSRILQSKCVQQHSCPILLPEPIGSISILMTLFQRLHAIAYQSTSTLQKR